MDDGSITTPTIMNEEGKKQKQNSPLDFSFVESNNDPKQNNSNITIINNDTTPTTTTIITESTSSNNNDDNNNNNNNHSDNSEENTNTEDRKISLEKDKLESHRDTRSKVVNEILNTEKFYVNSLGIVIKYFLQPMRARSIITPELIDTIFFNIETIYRINTQFLSLLTQAILGPPVPIAGSECIGEIFLSSAIDFQSYIDYCKAHQNSILAVAKVERLSTFSAFLENVKSRPEIGKLDLSSFLIMPVQRVPRYQLLLTEILNHTPPTHRDFNSLQSALARVCNAGISINESIRHHEALQKVVLIQKRFIGQVKLIAPNRTFVREGALMKVCRKVPKSRWFILFNDVLVYSNTITPNSSNNNNTSEYQFAPNNNNAAPLLSFHRMIKVNNISRIRDLKGSKFHNYSFQIISNEKSFTVFAESESEKELWMKDLQSLVKGTDFSVADDDQSNHNLELEEAPVWVPDYHVKRCMICGNTFSIIFRRHHCRNCGKVVCGTCSSKKRVLPFCPEEGLVRVCNFCYDYLELPKKDDPKNNTGPIPILLSDSPIDVIGDDASKDLQSSMENDSPLTELYLSPQNLGQTLPSDTLILPQIDTPSGLSDLPHSIKSDLLENLAENTNTNDATISPTTTNVKSTTTKDSEVNVNLVNTQTEDDNNTTNTQHAFFSKSAILDKIPKLVIGRRNPSEKSLVHIFT